VAEQPRLDVLGPQRLGQQRVVHQIDLAYRKVVGRPPVAVQRPGLILGQRVPLRRRGLGHRRSPRTTTTGQAAWLTQWMATEPVSISVNPPWPRWPTTSRLAVFDSPISTWTGWP
jgi:hypothetical protein